MVMAVRTRSGWWCAASRWATAGFQGGKYGLEPPGGQFAGAVLGELDHFQRIVGAAQVSGHAGQAVEQMRGQGDVAGFGRGAKPEQEVALACGGAAGIVGHPPGDAGEVGDGGEQLAADRVAHPAMAQQLGGGLELGNDSVTGEASAVLVVPGAERRGGGADLLDVRHADLAGALGPGKFPGLEMKPRAHRVEQTGTAEQRCC